MAEVVVVAIGRSTDERKKAMLFGPLGITPVTWEKYVQKPSSLSPS
jgi:hypothetical protein